MEKFTILGGRGYIGSAMARFLQERGIPYQTPLRGDVAVFDRELGSVIYCIGYTADYNQNPLQTVEAHVGFLGELLSRASFSSLIYLSSTRLYDGLAGVASENSDLILNPNRPRHLFDLSKALGESLCMVYKGRCLAVARLSSVYDPNLTVDNFLHDLIRRSLGSEHIELQTSYAAERDYILMDDVCEGLFRLAGLCGEGIYNVASGVNLSNAELIEILQDETGCRITVQEGEVAMPSPLIDIRRMREECGFRPKDPRKAIREILFHHKRRKESGY